MKNESNPVDPNDTSKTLLDHATLISTLHLINEMDHKLAETKQRFDEKCMKLRQLQLNKAQQKTGNTMDK